VVVAPHYPFSLRGRQTISFNNLIRHDGTQSFACSRPSHGRKKPVRCSKHKPCLPGDRRSIQTHRATTCRARSCVAAVAFARAVPRQHATPWLARPAVESWPSTWKASTQEGGRYAVLTTCRKAGSSPHAMPTICFPGLATHPPHMSRITHNVFGRTRTSWNGRCLSFHVSVPFGLLLAPALIKCTVFTCEESYSAS
jgi:hypothetical protein